MFGVCKLLDYQKSVEAGIRRQPDDDPIAKVRGHLVMSGSLSWTGCTGVRRSRGQGAVHIAQNKKVQGVRKGKRYTEIQRRPQETSPYHASRVGFVFQFTTRTSSLSAWFIPSYWLVNVFSVDGAG